MLCSRAFQNIKPKIEFQQRSARKFNRMLLLPDYDPNDNEAGMKLIEDLTTNADQIQKQVLSHILAQNSSTEYLKKYLNGCCNEEAFKEKVPVVNYEDIKSYIERIANGEPSNIISGQQITELLTRFG